METGGSFNTEGLGHLGQCSEIIPGGIRGTIEVLRIKSWSAKCKESSLLNHLFSPARLFAGVKVSKCTPASSSVDICSGIFEHVKDRMES